MFPFKPILLQIDNYWKEFIGFSVNSKVGKSCHLFFVQSVFVTN